MMENCARKNKRACTFIWQLRVYISEHRAYDFRADIYLSKLVDDLSDQNLLLIRNRLLPIFTD